MGQVTLYPLDLRPFPLYVYIINKRKGEKHHDNTPQCSTTFAITVPIDLSSKPGGVVVTTEFHMPNYLSSKNNQWVSSEGTILSCEELFEALLAHSTQVYLSNYDFQEM